MKNKYKQGCLYQYCTNSALLKQKYCYDHNGNMKIHEEQLRKLVKHQALLNEKAMQLQDGAQYNHLCLTERTKARKLVIGELNDIDNYIKSLDK